MPLKSKKLEASMYQGNGSNSIAKQRLGHQSFYFIVRLLQIINLSICQLPRVFERTSRVGPKMLQYISVTQTDHSVSGPPKHHSSVS